jgi:hypothetical protein
MEDFMKAAWYEKQGPAREVLTVGEMPDPGPDIVGKVNAMFAGVTEDALDDPQTIIDEIHALATGESQKFRTLVGQTGNHLMALRNAVPIEEYLAKIALNFA